MLFLRQPLAQNHKGRDRWSRPSFFRRMPGLLVSVDSAQLVFESCLRRGEPRRKQTERRARNVVEPDAVAELDALRTAAMLTADAHLQVLPRVASLVDRALHQLAHACLIESGKRVLFEDASLEVCR